MIDDRDVSLDRSIVMWKNLPLDSRCVTPSLDDMDNYVTHPYTGLVFYSKKEDDFYKVLEICDGYKDIRSRKISRNRTKDSRILTGYYVKKYEPLSLGKKDGIVDAYIEDGYLYIVLDEQRTKIIKVGKVVGEPGFSPQISENENNNLDPSKGELIYKLDTLFENLEGERVKLTTPNLIAPYVIGISLNENNQIIFTLSNGTSYSIGPIGIRDITLNDNGDLIIDFNNGESKTLSGFAPSVAFEEDNSGVYLKVQNYKGTIKSPNIRGFSAYEIAVRSGFIGTEAEWLETLKGKDGTSISIIGTLQSIEELPVSGSHLGDCYLIDGDLWIYSNSPLTDDKNYRGFTNAGRIQGPAGREVQMRVNQSNMIQWKYIDEVEWNDLIGFSIRTITESQIDDLF